jgi:hypothetical protein
MKKLIFLIALLWASIGSAATVPTTGLIFTTNCANISNPVANQTLCFQTTTAGGRTGGQLYTYNGSSYTQISGGGAPTDATYITQTANSTLTNEQAIAALSTGLLKGTTTTGVVSTATAGTDYAAPPSGSANTPLFNDGSGGFTNGTRSGNTTTVVTTTGSQTSGRCVEIDANGNHVQASGACGIAGSGYGTIQEEGSNLTARTTMNFIGPQVTAADDSGNSRTNITVAVTDANLSTTDVTTNDVSTSKHGFAPKAPNDATKYLDGTGNYSVPAGSGGGGLTLVEAKTITSNSTTVTFSGLDGDTDGIYLLLGRIVNASGASPFYSWRPNNVTTNQLGQLSQFYNGNTNFVQQTSTLSFANINSGNTISFEMKIFAKSNPNGQAVVRQYTGTTSGAIIAGTPGTNPVSGTVGGQWNDTSTNITSIVIVSDQTNGIGNGSTIALYKYAQ